MMYEYRARIRKVVDGDTVHATIDLGLDVAINETLRLYGLNAPEMSTPDGPVAKQWLIDRLARCADTLVVRTLKDRREKYGRYLATLVDPATPTTINEEMIAAGLAVVYLP